MLVARREDELRRLAAELDGGAEVEVCDVADRAAVQTATARILERHPEIDLLVNSAGILVRGTFVDAPLDEIERALVVNYLGCVWVTRGLLDGIRAAAATRGRADIATIASIGGAIVFSPAAPYSASKYAQVAFSRSLRASLRGSGVEVHTILPGFVTTPGFPASEDHLVGARPPLRHRPRARREEGALGDRSRQERSDRAVGPVRARRDRAGRVAEDDGARPEALRLPGRRIEGTSQLMRKPS